MPVQIVEPQWPVHGVVRRTGHWGNFALGEKPFTPWSVNCRPDDPIMGRYRGGSRPGLTDIAVGYLLLLEQSGLFRIEGGGFLVLEGIGDDLPGMQILTEDGVPIWTESGSDLETDSPTAEAALMMDTFEAIRAFGVANITAVASDGTAPTDYTLGCVYRDRLVLSGADHIVYMSRSGDWTDWDYGADVEDAQRAFVYQLSEAGEQGKQVTAVVPHRDSVLWASTRTTLWALDGDPADSGNQRWVSRDVGILSNTSWCKAGDTLFFLSHDGLYSLSGNDLKNISGDKLPDELSDIDPDDVTVLMGYSHADDGIYIFLVGSTYHWFFDLTFGGFWPFKLSSAHQPEAVFQYDGQMVLWDGSSGYWTPSGTTDDGTAIQSHVLIGPFRFGSAIEQSILSAIHAVVDTSGSVTWALIKADTAEEVCANGKAAIDAYVSGDTATANGYVSASGTWTDGRSFFSHPRVSGMWAGLWLRSASTWAFEALSLEVSSAGGWR